MKNGDYLFLKTSTENGIIYCWILVYSDFRFVILFGLSNFAGIKKRMDKN